MIFHHIHHKVPIYKDCTLMELLLVGGSYLVLGGVLVSLLTKLLLGYGCIGMAFILLSLIHATRFFLGKLQRIKYGKPYGYYQQALLKKLSTIQLMTYFWHAPWVMRQGRWSVRRIAMKFEYLFTAWKKEDRDAAVIRLQKQCIAVLLLLGIVLLIGWISAPSRLRIYIPPDLRNGATLKIHDIPDPFIYSFAYEVWQELNHWPTNGSSDYPNNLRSYAAYVTPEFQAELKHEFQELTHSGQSQRQRVMQGVASGFDAASVKKFSNTTWEVNLKMHLQEYKNNQRVKDAVILYPLKIIRHEGSASVNPYGLALAGFSAPPTRLNTEPRS